jgi:isopenicillin-N N-acyltransferase like protein
MRRPPLRILDAAGSPEAIGHLHGATFADEIRAYTDDRVGLVASGSWSGGKLALSDVMDLAESMLPAHEAFNADLYAELVAMANAAGITPAEAVIVGGFTDFVDAVRAVIGGPLPAALEEDDCTSVIVPDGRAAGTGFLAQTWDMHDTATEHVLMLRLRPRNAPNALVFTTTGCLGQIGMNAEGVAVAINNLTGLDGRPGVTWTSVVRGMLQTSTADEALGVLLAANLAGAHNFMILDRYGVGYNVEAMPSVRPFVRLGDEPILHTNHAIDPAAEAIHAEKHPALDESSRKRFARGTELLADGEIDLDRLIGFTRDGGSICQVSVAPFHIESSGAAIMRPRTGDFWGCWGLPSHNDFHRVEMPR